MKKLLLVLILNLLTSACSSVDSVQVFDAKQARLLLNEQMHYPSQTSLSAKRHQLSVDGKTQQGTNSNNNSQ